MTIEFRTVTFGDVATIVGGGTPSTKDSENYGGGIPWITPKDLSTHHSRYIESGERSISAKGLSSSSAKLLPANSVLFTSRAPIGYVALARNEITTNQGFKSLVLKDGNIPEYFYYLLKHYTPRIESFASGSTFMEISGGALKGIEIRIPSIPMQKAIAHILGTLDDKIELNQKMNQTLEDIAKAIFKSWFVDFDPVRAKAEGRPTGLSPEISDLFPDELVNSEIGEIPKGWDRVQFTDTFEFFSGGTPKTSVPDYWDGEIPWFSIADLNTSSPWVTNTEKSITDLGLSKCSAKLIERGTTIITARGTVGKIALAGQDMAINQSCYAMRASEDRSFTWLYLQTLMLIEQLQANAHGSVFDTITRNTFAQFYITHPTNNLMKAFRESISSVFERMLVADQENSVLSELRDTLLPKLISGELRVPDAEKFLEEAGI